MTISKEAGGASLSREDSTGSKQSTTGANAFEALKLGQQHMYILTDPSTTLYAATMAAANNRFSVRFDKSAGVDVDKKRLSEARTALTFLLSHVSTEERTHADGPIPDSAEEKGEWNKRRIQNVCSLTKLVMSAAGISDKGQANKLAMSRLGYLVKEKMRKHAESSGTA